MINWDIRIMVSAGVMYHNKEELPTCFADAMMPVVMHLREYSMGSAMLSEMAGISPRKALGKVIERMGLRT